MREEGGLATAHGAGGRWGQILEIFFLKQRTQDIQVSWMWVRQEEKSQGDSKIFAVQLWGCLFVFFFNLVARWCHLLREPTTEAVESEEVKDLLCPC